MTEQPDNSMILSAIERIFTRLDGIDKRFDGIDKRFDGVDRRLDHMDERFSRMESATTQNSLLLASSAGDITDVAKLLIRHLNDHTGTPDAKAS